MLQLCRDPDLLQEPLGPEHCCEIGPEYLDGYVTVVAQVSSEVYGRHAASADFTVDGIAVLKSSLETVQYIGHDDGS
jgi:hypothetical protein